MPEAKTAPAPDTKAEPKTPADKFYGKEEDKKPEPEKKDDGKTPPPETKPETKTEPEKTVVPEKYDLKLPEGSPLQAAHLEKIAAKAKERGLSEAQAQALVEDEHAAVADYVEGTKTQLKTIQDGWAPKAREDKEIGGATFEQNVEIARRVLDRYGTPELKKALDESRYGDHPELLRFVVRIGKQMTEDQLVTGGGQAPKPKTMAERFYPNQKGK